MEPHEEANEPTGPSPPVRGLLADPQINPVSISLPVDDDLDLLEALPRTPLFEPIDLDTYGPKLAGEANQDEHGSPFAVESQNTALKSQATRDSIELTVDDDVDLIDPLPESSISNTTKIDRLQLKLQEAKPEIVLAHSSSPQTPLNDTYRTDEPQLSLIAALPLQVLLNDVRQVPSEPEQVDQDDVLGTGLSTSNKANKDKKGKKNRGPIKEMDTLPGPLEKEIVHSPSGSPGQPADDMSSKPKEAASVVELAQDRDIGAHQVSPKAGEEWSYDKKKGKKAKKNKDAVLSVEAISERAELATPKTLLPFEPPNASFEAASSQDMPQERDPEFGREPQIADEDGDFGKKKGKKGKKGKRDQDDRSYTGLIQTTEDAPSQKLLQDKDLGKFQAQSVIEDDWAEDGKRKGKKGKNKSNKSEDPVSKGSKVSTTPEILPLLYSPALSADVSSETHVARGTDLLVPLDRSANNSGFTSSGERKGEKAKKQRFALKDTETAKVESRPIEFEKFVSEAARQDQQIDDESPGVNRKKAKRDKKKQGRTDTDTISKKSESLANLPEDAQPTLDLVAELDLGLVGAAGSELEQAELEQSLPGETQPDSNVDDQPGEFFWKRGKKGEKQRKPKRGFEDDTAGVRGTSIEPEWAQTLAKTQSEQADLLHDSLDQVKTEHIEPELPETKHKRSEHSEPGYVKLVQFRPELVQAEHIVPCPIDMKAPGPEHSEPALIQQEQVISEFSLQKDLAVNSEPKELASEQQTGLEPKHFEHLRPDTHVDDAQSESEQQQPDSTVDDAQAESEHVEQKDSESTHGIEKKHIADFSIDELEKYPSAPQQYDSAIFISDDVAASVSAQPVANEIISAIVESTNKLPLDPQIIEEHSSAQSTTKDVEHARKIIEELPAAEENPLPSGQDAPTVEERPFLASTEEPPIIEQPSSFVGDGPSDLTATEEHPSLAAEKPLFIKTTSSVIGEPPSNIESLQSDINKHLSAIEETAPAIKENLSYSENFLVFEPAPEESAPAAEDWANKSETVSLTPNDTSLPEEVDLHAFSIMKTNKKGNQGKSQENQLGKLEEPSTASGDTVVPHGIENSPAVEPTTVENAPAIEDQLVKETVPPTPDDTLLPEEAGETAKKNRHRLGFSDQAPATSEDTLLPQDDLSVRSTIKKDKKGKTGRKKKKQEKGLEELAEESIPSEDVSFVLKEDEAVASTTKKNKKGKKAKKEKDVFDQPAEEPVTSKDIFAVFKEDSFDQSDQEPAAAEDLFAIPRAKKVKKGKGWKQEDSFDRSEKEPVPSKKISAVSKEDGVGQPGQEPIPSEDTPTVIKEEEFDRLDQERSPSENVPAVFTTKKGKKGKKAGQYDRLDLPGRNTILSEDIFTPQVAAQEDLFRVHASKKAKQDNLDKPDQGPVAPEENPALEEDLFAVPTSEKSRKGKKGREQKVALAWDERIDTPPNLDHPELLPDVSRDLLEEPSQLLSRDRSRPKDESHHVTREEVDGGQQGSCGADLATLIQETPRAESPVAEETHISNSLEVSLGVNAGEAIKHDSRVERVANPPGTSHALITRIFADQGSPISSERQQRLDSCESAGFRGEHNGFLIKEYREDTDRVSSHIAPANHEDELAEISFASPIQAATESLAPDAALRLQNELPDKENMEHKYPPGILNSYEADALVGREMDDYRDTGGDLTVETPQSVHPSDEIAKLSAQSLAEVSPLPKGNVPMIQVVKENRPVARNLQESGPVIEKKQRPYPKLQEAKEPRAIIEEEQPESPKLQESTEIADDNQPQSPNIIAIPMDVGLERPRSSKGPSEPDRAPRSAKKGKKSKTRDHEAPSSSAKAEPEQEVPELLQSDAKIEESVPSKEPLSITEWGLTSTKKTKKEKKSKKNVVNLGTDEVFEQGSADIPLSISKEQTLPTILSKTPLDISERPTIEPSSTKKGKKEGKSKKWAMDSFSLGAGEILEQGSAENPFDVSQEQTVFGPSSETPLDVSEHQSIPESSTNRGEKSSNPEKRDLEVDSAPPSLDTEKETKRSGSKKDKKKATKANKASKLADFEGKEDSESLNLEQHPTEHLRSPTTERQTSLEAWEQVHDPAPRFHTHHNHEEIGADDLADLNPEKGINRDNSPPVLEIFTAHHPIRDSGYQGTEASPFVKPDPEFLEKSTLTAAHHPIRDSGYQGMEASPFVKSDPEFLEKSTVTEDLEDPSRKEIDNDRHVYEQKQSPHYSETAFGTPLNISVEVDPSYDVSISGPMSKQKRSRAISLSPRNDSGMVSPVSSQGHWDLPTADALFEPGEPSPVSPATKDRSSVLFQSSPSTREDFANRRPEQESPVLGRADAVDFVQKKSRNLPDWTRPADFSKNENVAAKNIPSLAGVNVNSRTEEETVRSLFGRPVSPLGFGDDLQTPSKSPLASDNSDRPRLNTIVEYSPEESPIHKKSRSISDVGSPERGVKSRRRSATPQLISQHRMRSPLSSGTGAKPAPSADDHAYRLSWPPVDEDSHMADLDRSASRSTEISALASAMATQRESDRRSPSGASVGSMESISAIIRAPDARSSVTPPLRRSDRSVSGDLRVAHKKGEVTAKSLAKRIEAERELDGAIPSSSTYDPSKDKGKGRVRDMTDVYVSHVLILCQSIEYRFIIETVVADTLVGGLGRCPHRLANLAHATAQHAPKAKLARPRPRE